VRYPVPAPRPVFVPWLAALAAAAAAWSGVPETRTVTLLHTSDLHGQVLPVDHRTGRVHPGSLARVATLVEGIRSEAAGPVLVLDSGDAIQGTLLERYAHLEWGLDSPTVAAMNLIGYDAMAVGNHEFNFGLDVLGRARRQAAFPFLSANVVDERTGEPAFEPYRVVEADGIRIGILGLTTPGVPRWEAPEHYAGLRFEPMDVAAAAWVARMRDEQGCDLVVVLAHTGFEDAGSPGSDVPEPPDLENWAGRLTRVGGIDVLLTGHTHRDLPPHAVGEVIVAQPPSSGRAVTRIDLELERDGDRWRISSWRGANLATAGIEPDPALTGPLEPLERRLEAVLDVPVATTTHGVSVDRCRLEDCAAVDLIHAVQLAATGADVSLASALSRSTPALPPGEIRRRWIHALYVYPNTLHAVRVTGAELRDILEHAARYYDDYRCADDACRVLVDGGVAHYNVDSVAGVSYRIDPTGPEGDRVRDLRHRGAPLDPAAVLTLACNSYRVAGGGGFPHLARAERVWSSDRRLTELVEEWLGRRSPWTPTVDGNWWIGPELHEVYTP